MRNLTGLILAVAMGGCAVVDLPPTENPTATIAAAEERGVEDNPEARLHLQMAKDAVAEAETLMRRNQNREAKLALLRAQADAELALAMVRRDGARAEVNEVQRQIDELQADMQRTAM